jgi:hypothetical protein
VRLRSLNILDQGSGLAEPSDLERGAGAKRISTRLLLPRHVACWALRTRVRDFGQKGYTTMTWLGVVFLGAVALVLGNASPAPAEPIPDPKTDRLATLITPNQILVRVDFVCQEGTDTGVGVGANQPTVGEPDTNGFGFTSLEATGQRQTAEVVVNSFQNEWRPGAASANSAVSCGQGAFGRDSAEILIELP